MESEPTTAVRLRAYTGAVALVVSLATPLVTAFLLPDGGEDPASTLAAAVANRPGTIAGGWIFLALAALFLGGTMFLARATRGRGSAWGSAGLAAGLLGATGMAVLAMNGFVAAALVGTAPGSAIATLEAIDGLGGSVVMVLMTAQPLSILFFSIALWRGATVHGWVAVAGALTVGLDLVPVGWSGLVALAVAFCAMAWCAIAVLRRCAAEGWDELPVPQHRAWAGAVCAISVLVVSIVKDVAFPGTEDPAAAIAAGASPSQLVAEGLLALVIAVLYGGTVAFFAGSVLRRGSGLAIAGTVLGCAGAVSIAAMGVLDFLTAALRASHGDAEVFGPLGAILFPAMMPLLFAEDLMIVAFAAALWRARLVSWVPFAIAVLFAIIGQLQPTGAAASGQMVLGLLCAAWLAFGVLRARGALAGVVRGAGTRRKRTTAPAPARGALG